jgi:serpin B
MKKIFMVAILLTLLLTSACDAIQDITEPAPTQGEEDMEEINPEEAAQTNFAQSSLARETSPQVDPEVVQALADDNTQFAVSFYNLIKNKDGNIIFSPMSLSLALSMTLAGAETSTEQSMLNALQLSLPENEVHPAFNALLLSIEESMSQQMGDSEGDIFKLNIANSIWGQAGFEFKETFLDTLAANYGSGLYNVDFAQNPEGSREAINDWIEEETQDKIQDLIPQGGITPLTRLVLANAIYFNGSWLHPFSETGTSSAPFYLLDGSETTAEMMRLSGESFPYSVGDGYQAIALPYLSRDFEMLIVVPDSGTFKQFEGDFSPDVFKNILDLMISEPVNLEMPKFDFETSTPANDPLKQLGMEEAFLIEKADFTGMTEEDQLYITDVLHKATITVDEEGTEAAAATAVIMGLKAMPSEPKKLVIDRPFMFFIQHRPTMSILFMGRVTQP